MDRPLHVHTDVDVRFDDAIELLVTAPGSLFQDASDVHGDDDDEIVSALTARIAGVRFSRDVVIEVGEAQHVEALRTVLPLSWRAASADALFPTVDAQLEVTALSMYPPRVQLTLDGTYDPPFGGAGDVIDRVLVRRLATNVVEDFVREVAVRLQRAADETPLSSKI